MYSVSISKKEKRRKKKTEKDGFSSTIVLMYSLHRGMAENNGL